MVNYFKKLIEIFIQYLSTFSDFSNELKLDIQEFLKLVLEMCLLQYDSEIVDIFFCISRILTPLESGYFVMKYGKDQLQDKLRKEYIEKIESLGEKYDSANVPIETFFAKIPVTRQFAPLKVSSNI